MHSLAHSERPTTSVDELASRVARVADRTELSARPDVAGPLRFRGATYDAAVQAAADALGARPHVIAAHRIRRGGIGGFFATDLGVEVQVDVPGETIDEAVERLVESGADDDREAWIRELARAAGIETITETADEYLDDVVFERPSPRVAATTVAEPPVVDHGSPKRVPPAPTRRQVDLAVAAASEMVRLTSDQPAGSTVSIQVTVSTADGRTVSAEARIESPAAKPARRTTSRTGASS